MDIVAAGWGGLKGGVVLGFCFVGEDWNGVSGEDWYSGLGVAGVSERGEAEYKAGAGVVLDRAGKRGRRRLTLSSPPILSNGLSASGSIGLLELVLRRSIFSASKLVFNSAIGLVFVLGLRLEILSGTTSW